MTDSVDSSHDGNERRARQFCLSEVLRALKRLDRLLEGAVAAAREAYGTEPGADAFRGLHISNRDVEHLLAREPGAPTLWADIGKFDKISPGPTDEVSRLGWVRQAFGLSLFDMDLILVALAPEVDLRYERLYAYLQDDVTKKRPTVDLSLNLLCPSAEARLARRRHFAADAPLVLSGLLHLLADSNQFQPPLLSHYLKLDEQIVRLLLGEQSLDSRLAPFCKLIEPTVSLADLSLADEMKRALASLVARAWQTHAPLKLYFHGPQGAGKHRTAEALAGGVGASLLTADLAFAVADHRFSKETLRLLFREAWFQNAVLHLHGLETLGQDDHGARRLLEAITEDSGITILSGVEPWPLSGNDPTEWISVYLSIPDFAHRRSCWRVSLDAAGFSPGEHDLEALAGRFRLTPGQIAAAVGTARGYAQLRMAPYDAGEPAAASGTQPTGEELFNAARAQSGHALETLTGKIEPNYTWGDIVLPEDAFTQLREICQRVTHHHRVLGEWGFDRKLSLGKGVNALFAGPAGTGKTMAAEVIAGELQLDLYKIDLPGVISKYIGETEKNLDRIFAAAENANAILFFDEADALFGKRSEVRDSHDRYANIEISYLLQKMEQYEGVALLATNLRGNLDEAFMRRLTFTVHFPFPDEASRRRIWAGIWPAQTPLAKDIDPDSLARQFKLTGGNIKNIALAAAFLAAEENGPVTMGHLLHATRREYQKMGKALSEAELSGPHEEVGGSVGAVG